MLLFSQCAATRREILAADYNDTLQSTNKHYRNMIIEKLQESYIHLGRGHCAYGWPIYVKCYDICKRSNDQVPSPYMDWDGTIRIESATASYT